MKKLALPVPPHRPPPIRLLGDRILALMDPQETTTKAGVIVSAGKPPPENKGTVVAVGTGKDGPDGRIPPSVKVGDRILWSRWHATPLVLGEVEYLLFSENEVLGVIS